MKEKNYVVGYDDNPANVGNLTSYTQYRLAMKEIYQRVAMALKPGGVLVSVVKDYIEKGQRVYCSRDNLLLIIQAGLLPSEWHYRRAPTASSPFSAKARKERIEKGKHTKELDINFEDILVCRKPR